MKIDCLLKLAMFRVRTVEASGDIICLWARVLPVAFVCWAGCACSGKTGCGKGAGLYIRERKQSSTKQGR